MVKKGKNKIFIGVLIVVLSLVVIAFFGSQQFFAIGVLPEGEVSSNSDCSVVTNAIGGFNSYTDPKVWVATDRDGNGIIEPFLGVKSLESQIYKDRTGKYRV